MQQHDFNFDESYGLVEYCDAVGNAEHSFRIQECHGTNPETGEATAFMALAIPTNEQFVDENGLTKTKFSFFTLSRPLTEKGAELSVDWLKEHKSTVRLLEPIDGLKYGTMYLPGLSSLDDL